MIFMVVIPCINDIKPFIVQLMHMWSLLKQIKIKKAAPSHVSVYKETIIREPVSA